MSCQDCKPTYRFDFQQHYARRLNKVARAIVERAFFMGGSHVRFFRATPCQHVFPDGTPCREVHRGGWNPECPACRGTGVGSYEPPIDTVAIIVSNQHDQQGDKGGWQYGKQVRVVTPVQVRPTTFKMMEDGRQYRLPDKFEILDQNGQVWYLGYCAEDVDEPFFYGPLYNRVTVHLSAPPARPEVYALPGEPVFQTEREFDDLIDSLTRRTSFTRTAPGTVPYNGKTVELTDSSPKISVETPSTCQESGDPWGWE